MPGTGGTPYVVYTDLPQYLPTQVLNLATQQQQVQACLDATEEIDSYIRGRYEMPLLDWGTDLRRMTAYIAIYLLMSGPIGWAATNGNPDANITTNYYRVVGWPDKPGTGWAVGVQRQAIQPDVTPSIPVGQDPGHDAPQVSSQPARGWPQFRNGKPAVGGF